jgi:hypothetical protein
LHDSWSEQGESDKIEMLDALERLEHGGAGVKTFRNFNEED